MARYLAGASGGGRALISGCGAAYEVAAFHEAGYEVIAIDFSPAAVSAAARVLGPLRRVVRLGDFFQYDFGIIRFDIIYERAFLCSLPRRSRPAYCARVSELLRPGGLLIGFFFYDASESRPPFGLGEGELEELLKGRFVLEAEEKTCSPVPVFAGKERWQIWRRLEI